METQRHNAMRESPEERGIDEARLTIQRAERACRQQVKEKDAGLTAIRYAGLCWPLPGVCLAAIVLLLFQRLGQLG